MSKVNKLLAILLSLVLCVTLVGCTQTGEGESTLSPYFTETETSAPPPEPTLREYISALLPSSEGKRFELASVRRLNKKEGRTLTVLCWDSPLMEFENTSNTEEYTPSDRRRDLLASDLGVTLRLDHQLGGRSDMSSFVSYAASLDASGKPTADVIAAYSKAAVLLAQKGLLTSLSKGTVTVDTEREWYPEAMGDELSLGGDLYFVAGDISPTALSCAELFFFDAEQLENRGVDVADLYNKVADGAWTLDAMFTLLAGANLTAPEVTGGTETADGNIDDTVTPPIADPVTYRLTVSRTGLSALYFASGLSVIEEILNEEGKPSLSLSPDYTGEASQTLHARLISATVDGEMRVPSVTGSNFFGDNADSVAWISTLDSARTYTGALGVLPLPKTSADAGYVGVTSDPVTLYGVSSSLDEDSRDLAVIFLEQAGYFSKDTVLADAYHSFLSVLSDELALENTHTFDIHRKSLSFDLGTLAAGTEKLTLYPADGWASLIIGRNAWETYSGTIAVSVAEQISELSKELF